MTVVGVFRLGILQGTVFLGFRSTNGLNRQLFVRMPVTIFGIPLLGRLAASGSKKPVETPTLAVDFGSDFIHRRAVLSCLIYDLENKNTL